MSAIKEGQNGRKRENIESKKSARGSPDRPDDEMFRVSRTLQRSGECKTPKVNLATEITPVMKWAPGDNVELSLRQNPLRVVITPVVDNER